MRLHRLLLISITMYILNKKSVLSSRLPILVLVAAWSLSSCSGLTDSVSGDIEAEASIDLTPVKAVGTIADVDGTESIPVRARTPRTKSHWGGTNVFARQLGDEFWTLALGASAEAEAEDSL